MRPRKPSGALARASEVIGNLDLGGHRRAAQDAFHRKMEREAPLSEGAEEMLELVERYRVALTQAGYGVDGAEAKALGIRQRMNEICTGKKMVVMEAGC